MLDVEYRPLAEVKPYDQNPRLNDDAVDAVANSIREFGFRQPIVVDGSGVIVVGHTRWKAAQTRLRVITSTAGSMLTSGSPRTRPPRGVERSCSHQAVICETAGRLAGPTTC